MITHLQIKIVTNFNSIVTNLLLIICFNNILYPYAYTKYVTQLMDSNRKFCFWYETIQTYYSLFVNKYCTKIKINQCRHARRSNLRRNQNIQVSYQLHFETCYCIYGSADLTVVLDSIRIINVTINYQIYVKLKDMHIL